MLHSGFTFISPWRKTRYSNPNGACVKVAAVTLRRPWRKSGYSESGNCVEVASGMLRRPWRKSSYSRATNCVKAASGSRLVLVGDTTQDGQPGQVVLAFAPAVFAAFTAKVKAGG